MDSHFIVDDLNDRQQAAVTSSAQHLLVLAGAGSGKTRVLVHRIAWIIMNQRLSHQDVLAVTFTNKAASEMRGRIESLLRTSAQGMWVGTFHSLAHRLLRKHHEAAGLSRDFQILDAQDQLALLKRIHKELKLDENRFPAKESQWMISHHKDEGRKPEDIQPIPGSNQATLLGVYQAYEQACKRANLIDFSEILLRSVTLLSKDAELRAHYQHRFKHILVDEFQDTNRIQYKWIDLLSGDQTHLTIVGDDDQSIYGWRGARIENIQRFEDEFRGCQVVRLEQNYRSTAPILNAANAVIANNSERMGKSLWTHSEQGEPIQLYAAFNEVEEARFVAERIKNWLDQGMALKDMAVLYRSNAQSRVIEEALIRSQIEYKIYGGVRFFDRAEIKNALAYLRLAHSTQDDAAFERIINFPTRGIGERTLATIRETAKLHQISLWQGACQLLEQQQTSGRAASSLKAFIELMQAMQAMVGKNKLTQIIEFIYQQAKLKAHYEQEKTGKARTRIENLSELITAASQFDAQGDISDEEVLPIFLDHVALESSEHQADSHQDAVQLMTLHASKGLEFPIVFLVGMEEGLFPSQRSMHEAGKLEEERRLCYVGITRAMQQLYMSYAETRHLYGKEHYASVSRFIKEIPSQWIEEIRLNATLRRPINQSYNDNHLGQSESGFFMGQRVHHPIFGEGTVLNFEGQGPRSRVQVNFDTDGSKWLLTQMAKLETLETG